MKDIEKVEELLKKSREKRKELDIDKKKYNEITRKLEEEKLLKYSDLTNEELTVINLKEDMEEFDYFGDADDITIDPVDNIEDNQDGEVSDANLQSQEQVLKKVSKKTMPNKFDKDSKPLIEYHNVGLKYGKDEVLKGISLDIRKGEFIYFVGKSGAGKSSLIKLLYRDVKNTSGKLILDDDNVTKMKTNRLPILRRKVGVIFQDFKLLTDKTVYENVLYSLEVTKFKRSERKNKVLETLKMVGMIDKKDKFPDELSGGQQQRVAIARAIVDDPLIVVADEPTGNLDPENAIAIMEILKRINESGTTIVMATHDVGIVNKYISRVVLFKDGLIENESEGGYIYE